MSSASLLVRLTRGRPVVQRKLDEAHAGLGLPRKTFTRIFRSFSNPVKIWRYHQTQNYFRKKKRKLPGSYEPPVLRRYSISSTRPSQTFPAAKGLSGTLSCPIACIP